MLSKGLNPMPQYALYIRTTPVHPAVADVCPAFPFRIVQLPYRLCRMEPFPAFTQNWPDSTVLFGKEDNERLVK